MYNIVKDGIRMMSGEHFDPTFLLPAQPEVASARAIRAKIRAWVTSPWLVDLVTMFNGKMSSQSRLDDLLRDLQIFSDRWDFRRMAREQGVPSDDGLRQGQGAARWLTDATGLTEAAEARILQNARHLGLIHGIEPSQSSYDCIIVLGGARLSCKLRPMRAAEVMRAGVTASAVALLGATRPVSSSERDATDTYAPGAVDEFDLIVSGGQQAIGFDSNTFAEERYDHPRNSNLSWIIRRFRTRFKGCSLSVVAVSAPSSDPDLRRANSADTLTFFLDREPVSRNGRLLLVTSQIYVPYVQLEALRTVALPRNLFVETIGFPGDRMPELQGLGKANHYLQEVRSGIQAAHRLCEAYPE